MLSTDDSTATEGLLFSRWKLTYEGEITEYVTARGPHEAVSYRMYAALPVALMNMDYRLTRAEPPVVRKTPLLDRLRGGGWDDQTD